MTAAGDGTMHKGATKRIEWRIVETSTSASDARFKG